MENLFLYWLIFGLLLLILEMGHSGLFFFFSFFIGTLGAALISLLNISLYYQIGFFFVVSSVTFALLWFKVKRFDTSGYAGRTNVFALQGKKAIVIEEIKPLHQGMIKIGGELWTAKARDNEFCAVDSVVEVIDVIGCHCIVRLVSNCS